MAAHKQRIFISHILYNVAAQHSTAMPMFLSLRNSDKLFTTMCDVSGGNKSKMVVHKQKILRFMPIYNVAAQFHWLKQFL